MAKSFHDLNNQSVIVHVQSDGADIGESLNRVRPNRDIVDIHCGVGAAQIHHDIILASDVFIPDHEFKGTTASFE